ncbi:MAG: hypothetical protein SGI71_06770 [Verrucomicrobiota bacterium]|nr:hypothetical protein [Verrucomicrobiota bacterium]
MGSFRHFVDKVTGCIFKTVIIGCLAIGSYFLWNGWGYASMSSEDLKEQEKASGEPLTKAEKKSGFQGLKEIFGGINSELGDAASKSETNTNVHKEKEKEEE